MARLKIGLILAAAVVFFGLVYAHVEHGLNGPWYWKWGYRPFPIPLAKSILPLMVATLPALAVQFLDVRKRSHQLIGLLGLMAACFGLKLAAVLPRTDPPSLNVVVAVVEQPSMTSYYTDAASVKDLPLKKWVSDYPQRMGGFNLHTQSKPPGPMIYWWTMIQLLGEEGHRASRIGGLILGFLTTLAIPATFLLLRTVLRDNLAAFCGASFLSLCPAFVLFFPMLDPAYAILSTAMIGSWWIALQNPRPAGAIALGLTLAATLLMSFSTLVLGVFMLALIAIVPPDRPPRQRLIIAGRQAAIAFAAMLTGLLVLWLVIGYNPVATFAGAWKHQHELLAINAAQRQYRQTIFFDLTDFALGVGWIGVLLAVASFIAPRQQRGHAALVAMGLSQFLFVAATALLQSETARVWSFMLPLLMIGAGLELSRWPRNWRIACLTALALLTAVIHQNMQFLY